MNPPSSNNKDQLFRTQLTVDLLAVLIFEGASLEELLREVELLDLPAFESALTSPVPSIPDTVDKPVQNIPKLNLPSPTVIETRKLAPPAEESEPIVIEDYLWYWVR